MTSDEGRAEFGRRLKALWGVRSQRSLQEAVASRVAGAPGTPSAAGLWLRGQSAPEYVEVVWAIEEVVGAPAGHLTDPLGMRRRPVPEPPKEAPAPTDSPRDELAQLMAQVARRLDPDGEDEDAPVTRRHFDRRMDEVLAAVARNRPAARRSEPAT